MLSKEEIEDDIENKINNDELFNIKEIKYLLNNHIITTFYDDTVIEVLNKSILQYIEQLETKLKEHETREQKIIEYCKSKSTFQTYNNEQLKRALELYVNRTKNDILEIMKGEKNE